jgi:hypothetical protein
MRIHCLGNVFTEPLPSNWARESMLPTEKLLEAVLYSWSNSKLYKENNSSSQEFIHQRQTHLVREDVT